MKILLTLIMIFSMVILSSCSEYRSIKKFAAQSRGTDGEWSNCVCYDYGGLNGKRRVVDCFEASDENACDFGCGLREHKYRKNICKEY